MEVICSIWVIGVTLSKSKLQGLEFRVRHVAMKHLALRHLVGLRMHNPVPS